MPWSKEQLTDYVKTYAEIGEERDVSEADCNILVCLLENCQITVPEENHFFVAVNCEGIRAGICWGRMQKFRDEIDKTLLADGYEHRAYTGDFDFGHTTAEWKSVISLGIYGLRQRIADYAEKNREHTEKTRFYTQALRVYDAALSFLSRAAEAAEKCGKEIMAQGIRNLASQPPQTLFEAMQTSVIYYTLQHMISGTNLRTLGRLDSLFFPYYRELPEEKELLCLFLKEIDRLRAPANIPFAIGGTDADGNSLVNPLSYAILEAYTKTETNNTKFHLLCSKNMPDDLLASAFRAVRSGNNSIVFLSDEKVIESIEKIGATHTDAADYHIVGCYECGADGELTCSCNARVNLPKALEVTLNGGKDMTTGKLIGVEETTDFPSFEAFYDAFIRQMECFCERAMEITDYYEQQYRYVHSEPFLSGNYTASLERGGDLYCDRTAKYNNSSLNAIGLATVTDSLAAIQKLVYEDKQLSMQELVQILKTDWENQEPLRLFIKNKFPKFGRGDEKTDAIAKKIVDKLAGIVSNRPNVKGGVYRLGLFSINWRWEFGEKTAATPDGRKAGETLSQNTSASFGADKEGATAHLTSVARIDASQTPNGTIADIDLHISAVVGENGIKTLLATLRSYFEMGGFGVHYNVLDTEVLTEAKKHPEKYPNLQVRLCGWNVLFSTLSEKEQDEFIARSMQ